MNDDRRWTLDHEHASPRLWHYYPTDNDQALCGKRPIAGSPIVAKIPKVTLASVGICEECWRKLGGIQGRAFTVEKMRYEIAEQGYGKELNER